MNMEKVANICQKCAKVSMCQYARRAVVIEDKILNALSAELDDLYADRSIKVVLPPTPPFEVLLKCEDFSNK